MVVLDTCAIIYDALAPDRLGAAARRAIDKADRARALACSDISLWEIAMLISKGRLDPGTDYATFMSLALAARNIRLEPITPEITGTSISLPPAINADPADRIILATAAVLNAPLVTCDRNLIDSGIVKTIW